MLSELNEGSEKIIPNGKNEKERKYDRKEVIRAESK
jgi:hypothetical protein